MRLRAILFALALFANLYFGVCLLTKLLVRDISHVNTRLVWLNAGAYLIWIVCGFSSAAAGHRLGIIHGAVFAIFSIPLQAGLNILCGGVQALVPLMNMEWLIVSIILGSFGGFVWDIYAWSTRDLHKNINS
jgi:hypothetical protein